jgi:AraC family transcriptional regulator of adaptative response/methylated-DNA-[protein]-cysteine methyltransferase
MNPQLSIIAESIDYLVAHYQDQPHLNFLATRAGYDAAHFQKLLASAPNALCNI